VRHTASPSRSPYEAYGIQQGPRLRTWPDIVAIGLCITALVFLIWGCIAPIKRLTPKVSALGTADPKQPALSGSGFALDAVYKSTIKPSITGALSFYGSWLDADTSTGSAYTAWYVPVPRLYVFVSGYPHHKGNQLFLEAEIRNAGSIRVPILPIADPMEYWTPHSVSLASFRNVTRIRLVAVDGSVSTGGWLGFSQPFVMRDGFVLRNAEELLLVLLCTAAALVIFFAPGLVLRQLLLQRLNYDLNFIWVPLPGLLGLSLVGLIAWLVPLPKGPQLISKIVLLALVLYVSYWLVRAPLCRYTSVVERRVLLIAIVLAAIAVAKASYSRGPVGELFGNTISRTLEVGGRSDSRLPYHVVQLVAWRSKPFSALGQFLYRSYGVWNFSHRGALSAVAAAPLVLAAPVRVPAVMPDQPWTVFDAEGFSVFRIAMIVMACCSLLIVFGLSRLFLSEEWALLAFLVVSTAPFVVHEVYFTWPKLEAGSFALLAAYLIFRQRYFGSGLALGLGYLCHPSALVATPALAGLILLDSDRVSNMPKADLRKIFRWGSRTLLMLAGCAVWAAVWRMINGKHFAQGQFLSYFVQADAWHPNARQWIHHRFDSLWKTFIPLHLFLFHRTDRDAISVYGSTSAAVLFCLQYWTSLPFGAGIAYFFCLLKLLWIALSKARAWLFWVFCIPIALFTLYWGPADSGLLREGLHSWFLGLMIFSVCILKKIDGGVQGFWRVCNWALLSRMIAVTLMLLLPTVVITQSPVQREFALSDIAALLTMLAGPVWLCWFTFRYAEILRKQADSFKSVS
jgi:hypothetical protein